jgi:iron complex outermembrane recepter protein
VHNTKLARHSSHVRQWATFCGIVMNLPSIVHAQEPKDESRLDEIIVTAQKVEENLQDIPVAVSAFTTNDIAAFSVGSFQELAKVSPAFSYRELNNKALSSIYMRGIGTYTLGVGVEPSVSVVRDGIPIVNSAQALSDLGDVERIEVLRGPQGVLFGKNASAGVINIISKGPTDTLQGDIEQTATTDDELYTKGAISGPINDRVAYRLSGNYRHYDGRVKDLVKDTEYNGEEAYALNGKLRWQVTDALKTDLMVGYSHSKSDGTALTLREFAGTPAAQSVFFPGIDPGRENTSTRTDAGQQPMATKDEDFRTALTVS